MNTSPHNFHKGFAVLFTVLVVSVLLAISLSISNITLRELLISSATRDSHIAFYAADTALECALYADTKVGNVFRGPTVPVTDPVTLEPTLGTIPTCGGMSGINPIQTISPPTQTATEGKISVKVSSPYCFSYTVIKKPGGQTTVDARGYNTCDETSLRRVERGIRVTY